MFAPLILVVAAAAPVHLVYEPEAAGCPDRATLEAAVAARLGYQPFDDKAQRRVEVHLAPAGAGLTGSLQLFEGEKSLGRRSFASPTTDCSELASSVELALAIAIDPQHALGPAPAPEKVEPRAPPPPAAEPPPAEPLHAGLGLSAALMTGLTPILTGTFGLELSLRWRALEFVLSGRGDIPSGFARLTTNSFTGVLGTCGVLRYVGFCAVLGAGALQLAAVARVTQPVLLAGARVTGRFEPLAHFWLLPFAEVLAIPTRVTVLSGSEVLWVTPPVAVSAGLVARYEFDFGSENSSARPKSP
jgi:hypothetical protein